MKILGIDCSSTCIGIGILEIKDYDINDLSLSKIEFVKSTFIKPTKKGNLIERIAITRNQLKEIIETEKPDKIAIEEIIPFMKGASTAKTIIMLTTFNRMACLTSYDYLNGPLGPKQYNVQNPNFTLKEQIINNLNFKKEILFAELFHVMSIRSGLKINGITPKKEDMPSVVEHHLSVKLPVLLNRNNKPKPENFDMADGLAVALYYSFILTNRCKRPKKTKKK